MRLRLLVASMAALAVAGSAAVSSTWSAWTDTTSSSGSSLSAAPDWLAPAVSSSAVGKSTGGATGYIRQGGTYHLYANVTDGGNPASGTTAVTAATATISAEQATVPLAAGSFTAGGVSYNRRSSLLTARTPLATGTYATTITTTDAAGNAATVEGPVAVVDIVAPAGTDVSATNGGGVPGRPDAGDTVAYSWSEPLDPNSVLSGWTGATTAVQVYIADSGPQDDTLVVRSTAGVALPLGALDLNQNFVTANTLLTATMTQSGADITIKITGLVSGTPRNRERSDIMTWSTGAIAGATDRAGNALTSLVLPEPGVVDDDF